MADLTGFSLVSRGEVAVAHLHGEVDAAEAPRLEQEIVKVLTGSGPVVVDLSAVTFLDSAGLRLLDSVQRCERSRTGGCQLVAPTGSPARQVLRLSGYPDERVRATVEEAVSAIAG